VHIDRFPVDTTLSKIPELLPCRLRNDQGVRRREYPEARQRCGGCPVAVIEKNIPFPALTSSPLRAFKDTDTNSLYVNMMPVTLRDERSLPKQLEKYWPLIEKSVRILDHRRADAAHQIGYVTIDERPVPAGATHRRPGLHVESPGVMPLIQCTVDPRNAKYRFRGADGNFVPGAEHSWGGGMMMRNECVDGGIFMTSNIAGTTAVWNCRINDEDGDFIGAHGDIEHLRDAIGKVICTKLHALQL